MIIGETTTPVTIEGMFEIVKHFYENKVPDNMYIECCSNERVSFSGRTYKVEPHDVHHSLCPLAVRSNNSGQLWFPFELSKIAYAHAVKVEIPDPAPGVTYTADDIARIIQHDAWEKIGKWKVKYTYRQHGGTPQVSGEYGVTTLKNGIVANSQACNHYSPNRSTGRLVYTMPEFVMDTLTLIEPIADKVVTLKFENATKALRTGTIPVDTVVTFTLYNDSNSTPYKGVIQRSRSGDFNTNVVSGGNFYSPQMIKAVTYTVPSN